MSYATDLSRRLAAQAESVCRAYLPLGRRTGRYWIAGDAQGTKGKSLFVKLLGDGAGHWTDAATGEHGLTCISRLRPSMCCVDAPSRAMSESWKTA
jgi:hypothetical protein